MRLLLVIQEANSAELLTIWPISTCVKIVVASATHFKDQIITTFIPGKGLSSKHSASIKKKICYSQLNKMLLPTPFFPMVAGAFFSWPLLPFSLNLWMSEGRKTPSPVRRLRRELCYIRRGLFITTHWIISEALTFSELESDGLSQTRSSGLQSLMVLLHRSGCRNLAFS